MRARNIKPRFFDNEILGELDPLTRLLFIGLWCLADREGRLEDRPKRIKKDILGYDECDCDEMLNSLNSSGFILRYAIEDSHYIQIVNFTKHQKPHKNEIASTIPPPQVEPRYETVTTKDIIAQADSFNLDTDCLNLNPERLNLKDLEANASCAEPPDEPDAPRREAVITLTLNDNSEYPIYGENVQEWAELYPAVDVMQQLRNMRGWLKANPTKRKTERGVMKFINSWLTKEQDKGRSPPKSNHTSNSFTEILTRGEIDDTA